MPHDVERAGGTPTGLRDRAASIRWAAGSIERSGVDGPERALELRRFADELDTEARQLDEAYRL